MSSALLSLYSKHKDDDIEKLVENFTPNGIFLFIKEYYNTLADVSYENAEWNLFEQREKDLLVHLLERALWCQADVAKETEISGREVHYKIVKYRIQHLLWRRQNEVKVFGTNHNVIHTDFRDKSSGFRY